jgi:neutral ceramidase
MDEFDPNVLAGLAESIARVVEDAWRGMKPARIGIAELLRFDPLHRISADRRPEDDNLYTDLSDPNVYEEGGRFKTKDHRLVLIKVVDAERNVPMAGVIRFGIHGTIFAEEAYTEDAPGGIEIACEEAFGVPVLFLQGAAGDVSPRGDDHSRSGTQQMEAVGRYTAEVARPLWESVPLEDRGEIRMVHLWRKINRQVLGYRENEFGVRAGSSFFPYPHGAFQCGEFGPSVTPDEGNPQTRLVDGELGCLDMDQFQAIFAPSPDQYEFPIGELSRAVQSAFQIGSWYFVTFPGEPVSPLMSQMIALARTEGFEKVVVLGYSQNHLFYLTPEEDWFQGGYEAAMNIWGWKLGGFLVQNNLELLKRLRNNPGPPYFIGDPIEPLKREKETRPLSLHSTRLAPHWISISTRELPILGMIEGSWLGGDSWLSPPWVKLVRVQDNEIVRHSGGFGFLITAEESSDGTIYYLRFQPGLDLPFGSYRFEASGRYRTPSGEDLPYTVTSPEFRIVGGRILEVTAVALSSTLRLYPWIISNPIEVLPVAKDLMNRYQISGFRMISLESGPMNPTPITSTTITARVVLYPSGETISRSLSWDGTCGCFPLPLPRSYPSEITAIEIPAPEGVEYLGNLLRRGFRIP